MVNVNVGDVVRFDYPQANEHYENVVGRIVKIRDTESDKLAFESIKARRIKRSRYLLSVVLKDGTFRTFYNGIAKNARHCTTLERVIMWLSGVSFPKFSRV